MLLPKCETLAWDAEWAENGKIVDYFTMVSCSSEEFCYVAIGKDKIASLMNEICRFKGTLVTHNGWGADIPLAKKQGYDVPYGVDTMCLAYLVDETAPKNLESLCVQYLKVPGWKHDDWQNFDPNSYEAAVYAARDSTYTLRLYRKLCEVLGPRVIIANEIMRPAHIALTRMSDRGIYINPSAVAREREKATDALARASTALSRIVGNPDFNPGSPKQVAEYLESKGVKLPKTPTGKSKVDEKVLQELLRGA